MTKFGIDPDAESEFPERKKKRKKTASVSPTQRSLKLLRERGYLTYITEHWCPFGKKRKDLYNFIDITGLHVDHRGVLGVQTTTLEGLNARIKKAENLESGAYWLWLACGNDVEFHGWRKLKSGWEPKIVKVSYKDIF